MKKVLALLLAVCLFSLSGCGYTRRTESLDDYLQPQVPMSFSEFLIFPIRAALDECTVNQYRSVSVSTLMFDDNYLLLSCTYTPQQYDEEISRFQGIGAEYREDLFHYPAYVTLFRTHNYEYALLDEDNLTMIYIAAHTADFEGGHNQLEDFPSQFAPIKFSGVDILIYEYWQAEGDIRLNNGESYSFFEHTNKENWILNGVSVMTASLKQVTALLEPCNLSLPDYGQIQSARAAAYYGASALEQRTPNWTSDNSIGAAYNERADVWIVHGMFKDRNNPGEAWAVVLDGETGKVLGFAEIKEDI